MIPGGGRVPRRRLPRTGAPLLALAVTVALGMVLGSCSGDGGDEEGASSTTVATSTTVPPLVGTLTPTEAVIAGQCLDAVPDPQQQTYAVLVIPCEESHTYEVYAQARIDLGATSTANGAPYPGALAVANGAEAQCVGAFDQFMGVKWESSKYDIQTWWPSEQSWNVKRDRTILCAVYRVTGGKTKGSVRGTGQ